MNNNLDHFESEILKLIEKGYVRADVVDIIDKKLNSQEISCSENLKSFFSLLRKGIILEDDESIERALLVIRNDGTKWLNQNLKCYFLYTTMYFSKEFEKGLRELKKRNDLFSMEALAFYYSQQDNFKDSIKLFQQIIDTFPNHSLAAWGMSEDLQSLKRYEEALKISKTAYENFHNSKYLHLISIMEIYEEIGSEKEEILKFYKVLIDEKNTPYKYYEATSLFLERYHEIVADHEVLYDKIKAFEDSFSSDSLKRIIDYRIAVEDDKHDCLLRYSKFAQNDEIKTKLYNLEFIYLVEDENYQDFITKLEFELEGKKNFEEMHFLHLSVYEIFKPSLDYLNLVSGYINNTKLAKTPIKLRKLYIQKCDVLLEMGNYKPAYDILFDTSILPINLRAVYFHRYISILRKVGSRSKLVDVLNEILSDDISNAVKARIHFELYRIFKNSIHRKKAKSHFDNSLSLNLREYQANTSNSTLEYVISMQYSEAGKTEEKMQFTRKLINKYKEFLISETALVDAAKLLNNESAECLDEMLEVLRFEKLNIVQEINFEIAKFNTGKINHVKLSESIMELVATNPVSDEELEEVFEVVIDIENLKLESIFNYLAAFFNKLSNKSNFEDLCVIAFEQIDQEESLTLIEKLKADAILKNHISVTSPIIRLIEVRNHYDKKRYQDCLDGINVLLDNELDVPENIIDQARFIKYSVEFKVNYSDSLVSELELEIENTISEKLKIRLSHLLIQELFDRSLHALVTEKVNKFEALIIGLKTYEATLYFIKYLKALNYYELKEYDLALEILEEIPVFEMEDYPVGMSSADLSSLKAMLYYQTENYDIAKKMMEKAIRAGVENGSYIFKIDNKISTLFKSMRRINTDSDSTAKDDLNPKSASFKNFFKQIDSMALTSRNDLCSEFKTRFKNIEIACHYSKAETALFYILPGEFSHSQEAKNLSLRFSPLKIVNDIQEGLFKLSENLVDDKVKVKIFNKFNEKLKSHVKIFCTSWDNLPPQNMDHTSSPLTIPPMWSRYALNFSGCVLIFDKNKLQADIKKSVDQSKYHFLESRRVIYSYVSSQKYLKSTIVDTDLDNILDFDYSILKYFQVENNKKRQDLFYYKPPQWDYEREFRFAFIDESNDLPVNLNVASDNIVGIVIGIDMLKGYKELFKQKCKEFGWSLFVYNPNVEEKITLIE